MPQSDVPGEKTSPTQSFPTRPPAYARNYDKTTGREVGAVLMAAPQSGSPMTYSIGGKQYIVVAISGGKLLRRVVVVQSAGPVISGFRLLHYKPSSTRRRSRTSVTMSGGAFATNAARRVCQSRFFT